MKLESILKAFRKAEGEQKDKAYSEFIEACRAYQILAIVHSYGSKRYLIYFPGSAVLEREEFFLVHGLKPSFEVNETLIITGYPYTFGFGQGTYGIMIEERKSKVVGASSVNMGIASYCPNLENTIVQVPSQRKLRRHADYFKNTHLRDLAAQMIG